jgi:hypothetical protein
MCQFISVVNIADDKNSILTRKRCCHLSDPVPSIRIPGVSRRMAKNKQTNKQAKNKKQKNKKNKKQQQQKPAAIYTFTHRQFTQNLHTRK